MATAILGPTEEYVSWGVKLAGREKSPLDRAFAFGYSASPPTPREIEDARVFWERWGISENRDQFIVCFFGTLGRQFDLETVIEAAKSLGVSNARIRFVICGTGDNEAYYRVSGEPVPQCHLPWVRA